MLPLRPVTAPVNTTGATESALRPFTAPCGFPLTPPSKMAKPTVMPLNSYAVSVQWVPPADFAAQRGFSRGRGNGTAQGGGQGRGGDAELRGATEHSEIVSGFRLRYRTTELDDNLVLEDALEVGETYPADATQATLKWLKGDVNYFFEVMCFNHAGEGDWSDTSEPFLMPLVKYPPALEEAGGVAGGSTARCLEDDVERPLGLSPSPDSIEICWNKACDRGSPILYYDIIYSKDPKFEPGTCKEVRIDGIETRFVARDLEPNTTYYFMHRATNEIGTSAWSARSPGVATTARPPEEPDPPVRLDASACKSFEVSIKWEPPKCFGMPIQHYCVRMSLKPNMEDAVIIPIGGGSSSSSSSSAFGGGGDHGSSSSPPIPSSPSARRPGFNNRLYALTQLRVRGLKPVTDYYFQVKALNQIGESPWSRPSAALRTAMSPPARCGQAKFVKGSVCHGVHFHWAKPDSCGTPITQYDVRMSRMVMMNEGLHTWANVRVSDPCQEPGAGPDDVETIVKSNWQPGVDHFVQVRAWNSAGPGDWSAVSAGMQVAPEKPTPPQAPCRFRPLPRAIVVCWDATKSSGTPITRYRLRYDTGRQMRAPIEVAGLRGAITECAVTGLTPHQSYHFQLAAVNSAGCSDWSQVSRPVQVLQVPPVKMSAPFLLCQTQTSIEIGFTAPIDCATHDGQLIQSYTVQQAACPETLVGEGEGVTVIRDAKCEGLTAKDLRPGKPYYFQVFAVNEFGEGERSEVAQFFTDPAPPEPPMPPSMVEFTAYTMAVTIVPGEDNGSPITHYALQVQDNAAQAFREERPFEAEILHGEDIQHYCVDGLCPGVVYSFRVAAFNEIGRSAWSAASQEFATAATAPGPIGELRISEVGSTSFRVDWDVPNTNGSDIKEYVIETNSTKAGEEAVVATTTILLEPCVPGSIAFARVAARNAVGQGPLSERKEVQLKPGRPYIVPSVLLREVTCTSVRIHWAIPYDGGDRIERFWVYYVETDTDGREEAAKDRGEILLQGLKHQCSVMNLQSLREYIFKVAAENSLGVGPYSEFSLPARLSSPEVPGVIGAPAFVTATVTRLTAAWGEAPANGAPILDQLVRVSMDPAFPEGGYRELLMPAKVSTKAKPASANKARHVRSPKATGGETLKDIAKEGGAGAGDLANLEDNGFPKIMPPGQARAVAGGDLVDSFGNSENSGLLRAMYLPRRASAQTFDYDIADLKGGAVYYVIVAARNSVGLGPFSPVSEAMQLMFGPPLAIQRLDFVDSTCESLELAWDIPDFQGSPVERYVVRYSTEEAALHLEGCQECEVCAKDLISVDNPSLHINHLLPGRSYYAKVRCYNAVGASPWTMGAGVGRTAPMVPAKMLPPEPVAESRTAASVTFKWTVPDPRGSDILYIELSHVSCPIEDAAEIDEQLFVNGQTLFFERDPETGEVPETHTFTGFLPGTVILNSARAVNDVGPGEWSERPDAFVREKIETVRCPSAGELSRPAEVDRTLPQARKVSSAPSSPTPKAEKEEGNQQRLRALDLYQSAMAYMTKPEAPSAPEAPIIEEGSLACYRGWFSFKVGQMRGLVYSSFIFRLYAGGPEDAFDPVYMGEEPLGADGQEPVKEWATKVEYEENARILQKRLLRSYVVEDLRPGFMYCLRVRTENAAGCSPWSEPGPCVRTPPDRPLMNRAVLSEFTSPSHISIRWGPPHDNGAPVEAYEVRYNTTDEYLPLGDWTVISEQTIHANAKAHGLDVTSRVLEVRDLPPDTAHFFVFRARNRIGYSDWSEASRFVTKPSRPAIVRNLAIHHKTSTSLKWTWEAPEYNGAPVETYDINGSMDMNLVKWCRLTCEMLWNTNDLDRIFGVERFAMEDQDIKECGAMAQGSLNCDESVCAILPATRQSYEMTGLVPGNSYYFMVRAIGQAGKGHWSRIMGPVPTLPTYPDMCTPLTLVSKTKTTVTLSHSLPHHNGSAIDSATVVITCMQGPLEDQEEALGAVTLEKVVDPINEETFIIDGLLPGTEYEARWACHNAYGLGYFSEGQPFKTVSGPPDTPGAFILPGM